MNKLKKLFFNTNMSWKNVLILSVVTGIAIGLIMIPDFLDDTSFQNPGVTTEFWFAWALFIILNCKTPLEAGLKTFIAFLVSQPIIYLVQVPFSWRGWDLFSYYKPWFILTLLTFPGGMIAWQVKKHNALSVAVLSIANLSLSFTMTEFAARCIDNFPHHLLTVFFIAGEIIFFILLLFENKKLKTWAFVIAAALVIAASTFTVINSNSASSMLVEAEGPSPYTLEYQAETSPLTLSFDETYVRIEYKPKDIKKLNEEETIIYKDANGTIHEIKLNYSNGDLSHDE